MRTNLWYTLAPAALAIPLLLTGCGTNAGPTLLEVQNVNGNYSFTASGQATDPVLFSAQLASTKPLANSGANYFSTVSGSIMPGVSLDLGDCDATAIQIAGKITNPTGNDVYIDMTGSTAGGGTLSLDGILKPNGPDFGGVLTGTIKIDGGSCPVDPMNFVANRQ